MNILGRVSSRGLGPVLSLLIICSALITVRAQDGQVSPELKTRPIYVTMRTFQLRAKQGSYRLPTDQVFKMRTASLAGYDQWLGAYQKTYPDMEAALLKTDTRRVYRTPKPTVFPIFKSADGPGFELSIFGAQSSGEEGEKHGTSLTTELNLNFGKGNPTTYATHYLEIDSGMTYFVAIRDIKFNPQDYAKFVRPSIPSTATASFEGTDSFLIIALSVELDKMDKPARYLDERESLKLESEATKKVQPEVPPNLLATGLGGFVRVRVVISSKGKVTAAEIQYSTFPEINQQALAAARQWEFPAKLFAEDKNPITAFVTFNLAAGTQK